LLAAHTTERAPGQLPPEGVVLIGVDLELQRRMAERLGFPALENIGVPNSGAPAHAGAQPGTRPSPLNIGAPNLIAHKNEKALPINAPGTSASDFGAPISVAPSSDAPAIGAVKSGAPVFPVQDLLVRHSRTYVIRPLTRGEDALTSAERELLRWLWDRGRPVPTTGSIRLTTGANGEGARRLASQAGLIYNTFKNLTRSLARKFAVDIVKPERNYPAIYAVYDSAAILQRQRQAGFTGVVHKNGGGRELVDSCAQSARRRADLTVQELEQTLGALNFGAP
jgi:hypothetical protein